MSFIKDLSFTFMSTGRNATIDQMTNIYYTVGPANLGCEAAMLKAGADGARLTFSYGTPALQLERAKQIRKASAEFGSPVLVMADLPGDGARLGQFTYNGEGFFYVIEDELICLSNTELSDLSEKSLPVPDKLLRAIQVGDQLVVGDGVVVFEIIENDTVLRAKALCPGRVENTRGITVQGSSFEPDCLTDFDRIALAHIAEHDDYDEVALSFVSSAEDIKLARKILGDTKKKVVAKVETPKGVENINEIAAETDVVMVARGDLALTMPWSQMPQAVDTIVAACKKLDTPFIMATQVAESMSEATMMSRAEMCDLWHWRQEGVAGVLLSRETGWGKHPPLAVAAVRDLLNG